MLLRMRWPLVLPLLAAPAWADCPAAPDVSVPTEAIYTRLADAPGPAAARFIAVELWSHWTKAPDDRAQALLDEGMERRAAMDYAGARVALDALVAYCPAYAEGWNQRAFVAFLTRNHEAALADLDRALDLNPRHMAALSGRGLTLIALDRIAEGQADIRAALEMNPWLAERRFLRLDPLDGEVDL